MLISSQARSNAQQFKTAQSGEQTNQYTRVLPAAVLWHVVAVAEMTPLAACRSSQSTASSVIPASRA
jgi:hypothetical protein